MIGDKDQNQRSTYIRKAAWIALVGNFALAALKLSAGALSGSLSVLSDGIDSSTDVLIAILTLVAAHIAVKPGDEEHPYGHGRIETVAAAIISFVVFFAGSQILARAAKDLFTGAVSNIPTPLALWATLISIGGKLLLAWTQFHYGKKSSSSMLIANGKNMRGDIFTSIAVLAGLGLSFLTGLPALDKIFAILVSFWILKNAIGIFLEANTELMEGSSDRSKYADVFHAVDHIASAVNPHRVRIRQVGAMLIIDLDIEIDPELSVRKAHSIAADVERSIKEHLPDVYDVIVHIEPRGNDEEERFGLSKPSMGLDDTSKS
ncbi:MAG: cation diffusion facilitator family transporter [Spirochaetia bacterium]|jgi:cation diffusion facilitator family transporter|nr:cation diffusion facilitator family transporter [Spirochaetales bacterium]MDX9784745.1 cation diffusion facilitator family transporter [Spirochaetia bacterium]